MPPRFRPRTPRPVLWGLAACLVVFGGTQLVGEASPLLQTAPSLGNAASFAVLAGSTVTNTGTTVINADLGVSPGSAVTGFPPGLVVGGTIHTADAVAGAAQVSTTSAYNDLAAQPCTGDLTGQDLGGKTLLPGVYCFSSSAQLTGTLTLNAQGSSASVFIFKMGTTLTTASNSSVAMINPGSPCNVFWQVGSSATLGTTTSFMGNILALSSITLNTGANIAGRALARNGAVTLDTNTVGAASCIAGLATPAPATATAIAAATATAGSAATATTTVATATAAAAATATAAAIPPPSSARKPAPAATVTPPTPTPTIAPATATAVAAAATATANSAATASAPTSTPAPTQPPPTAPAAVASTNTPVPTAVNATTANAPAPDVAEVPTSAESTPTPVSLTPGATPTVQRPSTLPRTGAGLPPLGLFSLVLGALVVVLAVTLGRIRK